MDSDTSFAAPTSLTCNGFVIRAYEAGDSAALARAVRESYAHLHPWMPWAQADASTEEYHGLVAGFIAKYRQNVDFVLGVFNGDSVIGGTGFHLRVGSLESKNSEIGMWIHGDRASQGLGTRVLKSMLAWGFTEWGFERLVWKCDPENVASSRVAEKCGLTYEGTLRQDLRLDDGTRKDSRVYAILVDEWRNGRTGP